MNSDSQAGCPSTYHSVAELAADLGLSERSTRSALRRGEIPHIRLGRRFILPRAAITEWLRTAGRTSGLESDNAEGDQRADVLASRSRAEVSVMTPGKIVRQA